MSEQSFTELLEKFTQVFTALPDKPEETAESVLKALWLTAAGTPVSAEKALESSLAELDAPAFAQLLGFIEAYKSGKPLSHITGRQQFCGIELLSSAAALIPRKETEILAKAAVEKIKACDSATPLVIDTCTGCGNLALYYASECETAKVYASDLSEEAVALARENAEFTGMGNRVEFFAGDLLAPFEDGKFDGLVDVLSCNPPYISSKKVTEMPEEISQHEPSLAFDGGAFGISILQKLIKEAVNYLKPGAYLVFELGLGQGPSIVKKIERNEHYSTVEGISDSNGDIRVIVAKRA